MSKNTKRVFNTTLVLTFLSAAIVLLLGTSILKMNSEIKGLSAFLSNTEGMKTNYEESLKAYTENIEQIISFLLELRPNSEEEFITFLASIEEIAQELNLKLNINSSNREVDAVAQQEKTLSYNISFYANTLKLVDFLKRIEGLPYFIRINNLTYQDSTLFTEKENINLELSLYIK